MKYAETAENAENAAYAEAAETITAGNQPCLYFPGQPSMAL